MDYEEASEKANEYLIKAMEIVLSDLEEKRSGPLDEYTVEREAGALARLAEAISAP